MRRLLSVLLLALLAVGCGGTQSVVLSELAFNPESYDGDQIRTSGVVVEFDEDDGALHRHYVIQDTDQNRVKLEPLEAAEPHEGRIVRVTGQFSFSETEGRVLQVEEITPGGQN
jgi:hypothetical protein